MLIKKRPRQSSPGPLSRLAFFRTLRRLFALVRSAAAFPAILAGLSVALHAVFAFVAVRHLAVFHARHGIFAAAAGLLVLPGTAGSHLFSIMLLHASGVRIFRIRRGHFVTASAFGFLGRSALLRR